MSTIIISSPRKSHFHSIRAHEVRLLTLGGLNGYSGVKCMSRKNIPPSYTDPGGPNIVETHSYKLSPFGPALKHIMY